jgi:hypothetical protein
MLEWVALSRPILQGRLLVDILVKGGSRAGLKVRRKQLSQEGIFNTTAEGCRRACGDGNERDRSKDGGILRRGGVEIERGVVQWVRTSYCVGVLPS